MGLDDILEQQKDGMSLEMKKAMLDAERQYEDARKPPSYARPHIHAMGHFRHGTARKLDRSDRQTLEDAYDDWYEGLSFMERHSVRTYTDEAYRNINRMRRGTGKKWLGLNRTYDRNLYRSLEKSEIPMDMVVYRGTDQRALGRLMMLIPDAMIGKQFTEKAYTSASTDVRVASNSNFRGNLLLVIDVPKGTKGAYLNPISQHKEDEILLQAGTTFTIRDYDISNEKRLVLHVEVTGQEKET